MMKTPHETDASLWHLHTRWGCLDHIFSLTNKPLTAPFYDKYAFSSLPNITNTPLTQQRTCLLQNMLTISYVLTQLQWLARCRKNCHKKPMYSLQGQSTVARLFPNVPTNCMRWTWIASGHLKIARASWARYIKCPWQGLFQHPFSKNTIFCCAYGADENDFWIMLICRSIPCLFGQ